MEDEAASLTQVTLLGGQLPLVVVGDPVAPPGQELAHGGGRLAGVAPTSTVAVLR